MKYVDITILLLIIIEKSLQKLLMPEKATSTISECVVYILNKYFNNSIKISIKYSNEHSTTASEILRKIDLPVLTNADDTTDQEIDKRIASDVSVIIDQTNSISTLLKRTKWDVETQFLVITTQYQISEQSMITIFQQFWNNNIVNVLLLIPDNYDILIYTFIPFNRYDCAIHNPVLLATWTSGRITPSIDIIPKERVTNLNGCTLNASVVDVPPDVIFPTKDSKKGTSIVYGIEGSVLMEISYRLNFKLNIGEPKDGQKWGRFEPAPYGAVGELFHKKIHFACGIFAYTLSRFKNLDVSVPISCERECITWSVPDGAKAAPPAWILLLVEGFSSGIWYFVAATAVFTSVSFRILSQTSKLDRHMFSGNIRTIFYIFRSTLGPCAKLPKSTILRTVFFIWVLYSFIISTAYQAVMGSKLTVPFRKHNIQTLRDLLDTDLHITGPATSIKFVAEGAEDDEDIKEIVERYVIADFVFEEAVEKIVSGERIAFLWMSTLAKYTILQHPKAKELIHYMDQCGHEYYPTMLLQKNCPFTAKVNRIIQALSEAGIICKWMEHYVYDLPEMDPPVQKLSLYRMMGTFVVLGAGWSLALIAFMVESLWFRFSTRKKCKRINVKRNTKKGVPEVWHKHTNNQYFIKFKKMPLR